MKNRNLKPGDILSSVDGLIKITSEYDSFHGWYEAVEMDADEDGNAIETNQTRTLTLADLRHFH